MNCPICNKKISLITLKEEFNCPQCNNLLLTNLNTSMIISFIVAGAITTPIALSIFPDSNWKTYIADALICLVIFRIITEFTLTIKPSTKQK